MTTGSGVIDGLGGWAIPALNSLISQVELSLSISSLPIVLSLFLPQRSLSSLAPSYFYYLFADTVCPRSSDPFSKVTYYIKWANTSWTDGKICLIKCSNFLQCDNTGQMDI